MKRLVMMSILMMGLATASTTINAQTAPEPAPLPPAATTELAASPDAAKDAPKAKPNTGLIAVIFGSGWLGVVLWLALLGSGVAAIYFAVDCFILIRPQKIMPQSLIANVKAAMAEGDVMKALKSCEVEPGPMANILSAGFSHVEEGFEVIQESIGAAADLETERIMQRLTWISVCSNLAPMLGLLGTVQGMIMCFETLATGAPDVGSLALAISQALWTTAGGLTVAIPAITVFYSIRNNANRLILRMQAMTMELIKDLRNVEVVND
jgi:biopolymer transport protein ExbB